MEMINNKEAIENWLNNNNVKTTLPLSQNEEFKGFISLHFPNLPENRMVNTIHQVAIALGDNIPSYSDGLTIALSNYTNVD